MDKIYTVRIDDRFDLIVLASEMEKFYKEAENHDCHLVIEIYFEPNEGFDITEVRNTQTS